MKLPRPRLIPLVFAAVIGSLLITAFVARRALQDVELNAQAMGATAAERIERLSALGRAVLEVELELWHLQEFPSDEEAPAQLDETMARLRSALEGFPAPPPDAAGERWAALHRETRRFEVTVARAKGLLQSGDPDAVARGRRYIADEVEVTGAGLVELAMEGVEANAQRSRALSDQLRETRQRIRRTSSVLTLVSVLLGLVGAWLIERDWRTRRRLTEARALHLAQRASELESFAGRVAHDIRNPLASAKLAAQSLLRTPDPEKVVPMAERINGSLGRAEAITAGLLEFARSGARPEEGARTHLPTVLRELLEDVAPLAEDAAISLELTDVPQTEVACSRGVYLSLAGNLVRNAIKYMGDAPVRQVRIVVTEEGRWVRTSVQDTGPGIPAESVETIFESYVRLRRTADKPGLGLGLATVKRLAEAHGGRAEVASHEGQGATFSFTLPRVSG